MSDHSEQSGTAVEGVCVYTGEAIAAYGFGASHPFSQGRHAAFVEQLQRSGLASQVRLLPATHQAQESELRWFHTAEMVAHVKAASQLGQGLLDGGDTPALPGIFEHATAVVGTTLAAVRQVMAGGCRRAFTPIAGLHHARPDRSAGFCVFNDCALAIELLRREYGIERVLYVDIDAHHGDGVFYPYEADPNLLVVDLHEDGSFLYPGTGWAEERGKGAAEGTKLNLPLPVGADDTTFSIAWERQVEPFLEQIEPQFILLQCGADGLAGDPLTHLQYSAATHRHVAQRLLELAERHAQGRLVAMGGGGYNLGNIALGWCAVVEAMVTTPTTA